MPIDLLLLPWKDLFFEATLVVAFAIWYPAAGAAYNAAAGCIYVRLHILLPCSTCAAPSIIQTDNQTGARTHTFNVHTNIDMAELQRLRTHALQCIIS